MKKLKGFVAYPANPGFVKAVIVEAIKDVNSRGGGIFTPWEENDIAGRPLTAPIFSNLEECDVLIADITALNFNVTYEIGYAIGIGRRVYLVKNKEIKSDDEKVNKIGIFDTLGYAGYENSKDLANLISAITDDKPLNTTTTPSHTSPVYIVETPRKGESMMRIVSRIKKARMNYRSFSPVETPRLSAIEAIHHVASSFGVIVPLLDPSIVDFDIHNIRAAFVSGISHGMNKHTLILQGPQGPIPLDVKDFVKNYQVPKDIDEHIHNFSLDVYEKTQEAIGLELPIGNPLSQITIGDPMAENEFQTLGNYYLQTDEFGRTLRGEVNLVVGRKGTGKTALFSQVRNKKRENRKNIVVDLKPEGYQLIKLKEQVLDYLSAGAKAHLITAFWEYLLYMEICYKILEKDKSVHVRDPSLYEGYQNLKANYHANQNISRGDFSERLSALSESIVSEYAGSNFTGEKVRLSSDQITALIHADQIVSLRRNLSEYLNHKDDIWILFDGLDKGWSSHGLSEGDIVILRCLIDATRKIQREMRKDGHELHAIVFIRNDVYQLLMHESPDFGKESRASLDWRDEDLLRQMLRKRLIANDLPESADFYQLWNRLCVSHYKGEETSQYFISRSLMRPRNLLKIFQFCRGFAVNLQHDRIEIEDIEKGMRAYSNDLIIEADQELTDIESSAKNLIYQFIGENSQFSQEDLSLILDMNEIPENKKSDVIDFLIYYGFLGVKYAGNEAQYIYDVGYDIQILKTRVKKNSGAIKYVLNPAFWPGLGISGSD